MKLLLILGFILTGCATTDRVTVPADCQTFSKNKNTVTVVCQHEVVVHQEGGNVTPRR